MNRRRHTATIAMFAGTLAGVVTVAGCSGSGSSGSSGAAGGTAQGGSSSGPLTVAVGASPNSLDPIQVLGQAENPVTTNIAETLYTLSTPNYKKILPFLATSYATSHEGKAVTIKLHKGVKFQDGTPFDAKAVKWNLLRLRDTPFFLQSVFTPIQKVSVVDTHTLKLQLKQPDPLLQRGLAADQAAMISPKSLTGEYGNTKQHYKHPVGTGPYVFKSYKPNSNMVMIANSHYWGKTPRFSQVEYRFVPEANVRESLIRSGQVDVIDNPPPSDIDALKKDPSLNVSVNTNGTYNGLVYINTQWKKLKDVRVRQALNYAIDRKALVKKVLSGYAQPALKSFTPPVYSDSCNTGGYPYNPKKAKQLLKAAGATHMTLKMYTPAGHYPADLQTSQAIAGDLRNVGINVKLQQFSWPTYLSKSDVKLSEATAPLQFVGLGSLVTDAGNYYGYFTSKQLPPAGLNNSYLEDKKVDAMFAKQRVEGNPDARAKENCQLGKRMTKLAPAIIVYQWDYSLVGKKDVNGIVALPDGQVSPSTYQRN